MGKLHDLENHEKKTTQSKRYQTTLNTGCADSNVFCELLAAKCMKLTFNRPNSQSHFCCLCSSR